MKNLFVTLLAVSCLSLAGFAQSAPAAPAPQAAPAASSSSSSLSQHATVKVAKFSLSAVKKVAGSVLFAAEPAIDAVHLGFAGAAAATNIGSDPDSKLKVFRVVHDAFQFGNVVAGKIDSGDEKAEAFFFGSSN